MKNLVKKSLKPYLNDIYNICKQGFEEAKRDRFWDKLDNRYRSTRISAITTHLLEEKFKELGIFTSRSHNTFRFAIDNTICRYKKLSVTSKLPQNIETFRNNQFIERQCNLINASDFILYNLAQMPITIGYYTDYFYSKIFSIEVICHALDFRFEIEEPQTVISISRNIPNPVRETKISASKIALEERLNNAKQKNNAYD
ncbi:MAG: hypothetical protein BHW64_04345 [Candidatus Melainabacteria bacterium LEY3_CP_29_8]|nr:MAG: hypothetical protein BHW64_04345 [Candidatus Melainabacteria bacterium LEY3_CP_29_8]